MFWFEIELPAEAPADVREAAGAPPEPVREPSAKSEGASLRVLVAEDNPTNQKVATFLLKKLGCEIEIVPNGAEAVRAWRSGFFDVILMDCQMPEMDGFQATRAIREAEPAGHRIPIVAVTANAMEGDRERCLDSGMDDYVSKPLSKATVQAALARLVDRRAGTTAAA